MTDATTPSNASVEPLGGEWLELVDQALLGLDHALNNRLGALRAFAELLRDEQWRADNTASDNIQREAERLEETASVVRLLARPRNPSRSGLIVEDVLADVARIQSLLYDVRGAPIDFASGPPLEPVWSERASLIRLLSIVLYALRRKARDTKDATVRVGARSDDQWVTIALSGCALDGPPAVSGYAASLAAGIGAECGFVDSTVELRLPTLKTRRASAESRPPAV